MQGTLIRKHVASMLVCGRENFTFCEVPTKLKNRFRPPQSFVIHGPLDFLTLLTSERKKKKRQTGCVHNLSPELVPQSGVGLGTSPFRTNSGFPNDGNRFA
ncbi:hypothetical protein CEXT_4921 [Caerostris extrusa]|uniref:Ycf15 n=1 Tax=Caerostris extrusa TaxID=172846 RepID=A0AAV4WCC7_CAEEX|nr:hypothetical protein CEXT_4921 [Caerostris extrusa]